MSTNQFQRQDVKAVLVQLGIEHIGTGNGYTAKIPRGAVVLAVGLVTETAFNSATTATGTITDGTTTFANAVDLKTTGSETVTNAPKAYPDGGTMQFNVAETGAAATTGRAYGWFTYLQVGAGCDVYG